MMDMLIGPLAMENHRNLRIFRDNVSFVIYIRMGKTYTKGGEVVVIPLYEIGYILYGNYEGKESVVRITSLYDGVCKY